MDMNELWYILCDMFNQIGFFKWVFFTARGKFKFGEKLHILQSWIIKLTRLSQSQRKVWLQKVRKSIVSLWLQLNLNSCYTRTLTVWLLQNGNTFNFYTHHIMRYLFKTKLKTQLKYVNNTIINFNFAK